VTDPEIPLAGGSWPGRLDVWRRLGLLAGGYGVKSAAGEDFADVLLAATRQGQDWVRSKVEAGEPSFVAMWNDFGMADRQSADRTWLTGNKARIAAAFD
jgi:hypothetical protein